MGGDLLLLLGSNNGVLADSFMGLGVHGFHALVSNTSLDEAAELFLVTLSILLLKLTHIIGNIETENVLAENFSIEGILLSVETGETSLAVGNVKTTVNGTLHGSKDLGTSRGAGQTRIKESLEGTGTILLTEFGLINTKVNKDTAGNEETSAVSSGKVGKTNLDTEMGQLVGISRGENKVTLNLGVDDLADDVLVGETDDEAVLGGVVLVLVLDNKALAGIVVSLSLTATTVLDLEAFEV